MRKWGLGCFGLFVSALILILSLLFVPGALIPVIAFSQRVSGLAEVKRAFPHESFAWSDLFQSYHIYSWDGTNTAWHFDPPSRPFRSTTRCAVEDVWDGRGTNHSVKACLIGEKRICESGAHIWLYRALADGSLIVHRTTGNLTEYCSSRSRRTDIKAR